MTTTTKKPFTFAEAQMTLEQAYKHTLDDKAFGDKELHWTAKKEGEDNPLVAGGYVGSRGTSVHLNETEMYAATSFYGEEARKLAQCGKYGSYERNDEG